MQLIQTLCAVAIITTFAPPLVSNASAETGGSPSSAEKKNYELSTLIKKMMGYNSYLQYKSVVKNIASITPKEIYANKDLVPDVVLDSLKIYAGKIPIYVKGKRFLGENMSGRDLWTIYVAGPNAVVSTVYITSEEAVALSGGASYFKNAGLKIEPLICDGESTNSNYRAYYKVYVTGKDSANLSISKSSGSGGTWYSYGLSWGDIKVSDLGLDNQRATVGTCGITD